MSVLAQARQVVLKRLESLQEERAIEAKGCVLASDAFFPFKDGIEQAAEAGACSDRASGWLN